MPILWNVLSKEIQIQLIRRIDGIITNGDGDIISNSFNFARLCDGEKYVSAIAHTYIGTTGSSMMYSRTDFYANGASVKIPGMVAVFDDDAPFSFDVKPAFVVPKGYFIYPVILAESYFS